MATSLRVFVVGVSDAKRVLAFYQANRDWHLMPRPLEGDPAQGTVGLKEMADRKELYALEDDTGDIVGVAYVHEPASDDGDADESVGDLEDLDLAELDVQDQVDGGDDDHDDGEQEFGGIYFDKSLRGTGVPLDFCTIVFGTVLASSFGSYVPVIAHTHVANGAPHKLLGELGFVPTDTNISLDGKDPRCQGMRQSIDGRVWGVVHGYLREHLAKSLAARIRAFNGTFGEALFRPRSTLTSGTKATLRTLLWLCRSRRAADTPAASRFGPGRVAGGAFDTLGPCTSPGSAAS